MQVEHAYGTRCVQKNRKQTKQRNLRLSMWSVPLRFLRIYTKSTHPEWAYRTHYVSTLFYRCWWALRRSRKEQDPVMRRIMNQLITCVSVCYNFMQASAAGVDSWMLSSAWCTSMFDGISLKERDCCFFVAAYSCVRVCVNWSETTLKAFSAGVNRWRARETFACATPLRYLPCFDQMETSKGTSSVCVSVYLLAHSIITITFPSYRRVIWESTWMLYCVLLHNVFSCITSSLYSCSILWFTFMKVRKSYK